jgi:superfamily I DNA/RNA helicase
VKKTSPPNPQRCAIYTRKSTEHNLDLAFNREFDDAVRLGEFAECEAAVSEITRRRTYSRPTPPERCISTIHKAKGLECSRVMLMPCDARHFPDSPSSRCLLYVAMSRAKQSLILVVSRSSPSPLLSF